MKRLIPLAILLLLPALARGSEEVVTDLAPLGESARNWTFEFNGGRYRPQVDTEAGLQGSPFNDIFGKKSMWLFELELDHKLLDFGGPLSIGLAGGYGIVWGQGIVASDPNGAKAPDSTTLSTIPLRALLTYRFQQLNRALHIPLVPFIKGGLADTIWWVTDGGGSIAKFGGGKGFGGKWGYEVGAGLALELNFFDRDASRDFDKEWGVNSVLLEAQWVRLTADNFGGAGINLSDDAWLFGLAFEL
jgi:hypothetical protein